MIRYSIESRKEPLKEPRKEFLKDGKILTDDNFLKIFVTFLKENKAYVPYRNAMAKFRHDFFNHLKFSMRFGNGFFSINKDYLLDDYANEIINYSFCWVDTKEGPDYWYELNRIWKNFLFKTKVSLENIF